jgi:hypothetical protein
MISSTSTGSAASAVSAQAGMLSVNHFATEYAEAHGVYRAVHTAPREIYRDQYIKTRDALQDLKSHSLFGRMVNSRKIDYLTDKLADFEQLTIFDDTFSNIVTVAGRNLALDTFLAGSSYTVVGPYLGLISSLSYAASTITTIASGAYTTGTGAVTTTTAGAHNLLPGDTFTIASAAGTGAFASLNGTWVATAGTTGTTLNFTIGTGLTMTITGGNVTAGVRQNDTMASHAFWLEAGVANAPTYTVPRKTAAWSAAANASKSLSAAVPYAMTGAGTVKGAFLIFGAGAVSTVDNTSGTLYSAGLFTGGDQPTVNGNTLNVSYTGSM